MVAIALLAMMGATLAHHLGLTEAIGKILLTVVRCPKCCSFWACLCILLLIGCNPIIAFLLSILIAYLSYWFGLVLYWIDKQYNRIWQRLQQRKE